MSTEHFAIKTEISALFPTSSSAGGGNGPLPSVPNGILSHGIS